MALSYRILLIGFSIFAIFASKLQAGSCAVALRESSSLKTLKAGKTELQLAADTLGITEKELAIRLHSQRMSEQQFLDWVRFYRKGNSVGLAQLALQPKQVLAMIRLRQIYNPNFLFSFLSLASLHTLSQAGMHLYVDTQLQYLPLLSGQLMALLITEVALNFSSARNAAFFVAKPELPQQRREMMAQLSGEEQQQLRSFAQSLRLLQQTQRKLKQAGGEIVRDGAKNFPQLVQVAGFAGLLSFSFLKLVIEGNLEWARDAEYILVNAGFHAGFISMWSNFRYQAMQGQIFPAISQSEFWQRHPVGRKFFIWGITGVNLSLAIWTYSTGSIAMNEWFGLSPLSLSDAM